MVEAVPLKLMESQACVDALVAVWISRFRVPAMITSDRIPGRDMQEKPGRQGPPQLLIRRKAGGAAWGGAHAADSSVQSCGRVLCHQLGINHTTTTAYHPQANWMVE
jgi:hypothetical protein